MVLVDEMVLALDDFEPDDLAVAAKYVGGVPHCNSVRGWSRARELRQAGTLVGIATESCKAGDMLCVRVSGWHAPEPAVG